MSAETRRKYVAGNWKLNGDLALVDTMQKALADVNPDNVTVVVCPPFPYLAAASAINAALGAQNLSQFDSGAHTGEIAASMLKEMQCQYVIVGHSERRTDNGESDAVVAEKVQVSLDNDLTPILCFGEPEEVRDGDDLFGFLTAQLDAVISKVGIAAMAKVVLAYEPIWAIGTGKTATPEQAQEVHQYVREYLAKQDATVAAGISILYGGSVKAANAAELFGQADIDGGLIGGASLKTEEFTAICQAASC